MKRPKRAKFETNRGEAELTLGVLDEQAVKAFTWGHCHSLALALHEHTYWPIMAGYFDYGPDEEISPYEVPGHMAVWTPDERVLDVAGTIRPGDLTLECKQYGPARWIRSDLDRINDLVDSRAYKEFDAIDFARALVDPILDTYDLRGLL